MLSEIYIEAVLVNANAEDEFPAVAAAEALALQSMARWSKTARVRWSGFPRPVKPLFGGDKSATSDVYSRGPGGLINQRLIERR